MSKPILIVILLCVLAVAAGALGGPSDTEAAADTAADVQEAPQQARAEIHHAQALAMLAASGHK